MNILGQIGNTPLIKLRHVIEPPDVDIYVKCEYLNPGGSIKDRMALSMIEAAEKSGKLKSERFFCGISSGANVWAAVQLARRMKKGSRIATVLVDRRDRYFAEYPHEHYVV
jgi:cysteine synthase